MSMDAKAWEEIGNLKRAVAELTERIKAIETRAGIHQTHEAMAQPGPLRFEGHGTMAQAVDMIAFQNVRNSG